MQNKHKEVLLREGGSNGFAFDVRMGGEPSADRVERVLEALRAFAPASKSWSTIPKDLACALYVLSFHVSGEVEGAESRGREFGPAVVELFPQMYELIDEIFGVLDD